MAIDPSKANGPSTLREHQEAMLLLLNEADRICKEHGIQYMLFAGTLLGAVRHQGFIPWDDDLDIIMLRSEYERFLSVAESEINYQVFFLQKEFSEHWAQCFSKLRLQNTAAIERFHPKDRLTHQGIYIDIFPADNLSDVRLVRGLQFAASKVVIAKELYKRGYETNSAAKLALLQLCRILPLAPALNLAQLRLQKGSRRVHCFLGAASRYQKSTFPREWLTETTMGSFEGGKYPISAHYNELLTTLYGDYKTLPPEDQRGCKIHAVIADTNNSYERYLDDQLNMNITSYERSIR